MHSSSLVKYAACEQLWIQFRQYQDQPELPVWRAWLEAKEICHKFRSVIEES